MTTHTAIRRLADLTPMWLAAALGTSEIADFTAERIGTGQLSESHRIAVRYAGHEPGGPGSVVLKVADDDERSRRTGVALGLYEREVRFYAEIAPLLSGPVPECHHASFDRQTGTFCLLLGDAAPAQPGNDIAGCSPAQAWAAVRALGRLHAPALAHAGVTQTNWLNRPSPINAAMVRSLLPGFLERYEQRITPEHQTVCERLAEAFDAYAAATDALPKGLAHGDYRLDNLLFDLDDESHPVTVVDWQTVTVAPALTDLAYFLGCALRTEDRRRLAPELVRAYHDELDGALDYQQCVDGLRVQSYFGVMMATISPMLVERTERGDDMFMTVLARHAQQALDLDALDLLPRA
ncbi:MAG TPA: phosphotransferase [Solirubrobacteraceae bacterium]|jgi:hypothetical protein|nr:phosphotransferase [Solirubrobacteraceae bacterium]